jgi:hypothetical protein
LRCREQKRFSFISSAMNNSTSTITEIMKYIQPIKKNALKAMPKRLAAIAGFGLLSVVLMVQQTAKAQDFVAPKVFQAAAPRAAALEGAVDAYRAALGNPNNGNNAPPSDGSGHREINWDGGSPSIVTTTAPVTPFDTFLNTRGSRFTTPGQGLSQAPASGGPTNGLVGLFNNPTYGTIFSTFSPSRLFTPVGSNITEALFFVPGTNGADAATVTGFGAVFTDVHAPGRSGPSTRLEYFDKDGNLIFTGFVPPSPHNNGLSFFGIIFEDARIARVRIKTGDVAPGPNDRRFHDIVVMDDFIYGEPQALP